LKELEQKLEMKKLEEAKSQLKAKELECKSIEEKNKAKILAEEVSTRNYEVIWKGKKKI